MPRNIPAQADMFLSFQAIDVLRPHILQHLIRAIPFFPQTATSVRENVAGITAEKTPSVQTHWDRLSVNAQVATQATEKLVKVGEHAVMSN